MFSFHCSSQARQSSHARKTAFRLSGILQGVFGRKPSSTFWSRPAFGERRSLAQFPCSHSRAQNVHSDCYWYRTVGARVCRHRQKHHEHHYFEQPTVRVLLTVFDLLCPSPSLSDSSALIILEVLLQRIERILQSLQSAHHLHPGATWKQRSRLAKLN